MDRNADQVTTCIDHLLDAELRAMLGPELLGDVSKFADRIDAMIYLIGTLKGLLSMSACGELSKTWTERICRAHETMGV